MSRLIDAISGHGIENHKQKSLSCTGIRLVTFALEGTLMREFFSIMNISPNKLMVNSIAGLIVFLSVLAGYCSGAVLSSERESIYSVYSHGFKVGEVKTDCLPLARNNKKYFEFQSVTRIDANFFFRSFKLDKKEEALVGEDGTFYYKRMSTENGKTQQVEGRLVKDGFNINIEENGSKNTLFFGKGEYDFTTLDCPEIILGPEEKEKTFRVLDFEHLKVVRRSYRWVRNEDITVDSKHIRCKVVDFTDQYKKCRRWVKLDELGVLIVRQDGKGKEGSYSTHITSLTIKPRDSLAAN